MYGDKPKHAEAWYAVPPGLSKQIKPRLLGLAESDFAS